MPAATPAVVIPETSAPSLGWDGEDVEDFAQDYDDYLESRPTKADLKPYAVPVLYWEALKPGTSLRPYPRMSSIDSTPQGLWKAQNAAQQTAVREHLAISTRLDPDLLKVSAEEQAALVGRGATPLRFCHTCGFVTSSLLAANLHETDSQHTTHPQPKKG